MAGRILDDQKNDPQKHKPGTRMPDPRLRPDEIGALAAYLGGLE